MRRLTLAVACLALTAGCQHKPSAPALRDEPIYNNSREGVRFRSPEGWTQVAKSDPPSDASTRDCLLVRYQDKQSSAFLELSRADLPENENLAALVAEQSHGSTGPWKPTRDPEEVKIGGVAATRHMLTNRAVTKETTTIRRGGRVYFFTLVFPTADQQTSQMIRELLSAVKWSN